MFTINDDNSIYATRGDIVFFTVTAEDNGKNYVFQPGDVLRIKVYGKKDAESVVLQKDFPVTEAAEQVEIYLNEEDTKIGETISKPKDYWYEVELNPFSNPQTIIGYDEDGAKVFKLFPEGDDIPEYVPDADDLPKVIDAEFDISSPRPVENRVVTRAVIQLEAAQKETANDLKEQDNALRGSIAELNSNVVVERARIDNLLSGATAEGSEVVDIRVGADGKTYGSAGTAVREQLSNVANDVLYQSGVRHGYKARFTIDGSYLHTGGYLHNLAGTFCSDLIPCSQFSSLRYRATLDPSGYLVGFYDAQRNLMEDVSILGDNTFMERVVDLSTIGAVYVRVSGYASAEKNANKTTSYFVFYTSETAPELDEGEKIDKTFDAVFKKLTPYEVSFDKIGYFAVSGNGVENTNQSGYCTEFTPCRGYKHLRYKTNIDESAYEVVFYDENRAILPNVSIVGDNRFAEKTIDISGFNAAFVRICGYENADRNAYASTSYAHLYNHDIAKDASLKIKDKQILIFGDSITETAYLNSDGSVYTEGIVVNWPTYIPEILGTTKIKNYAKSGAHFADFEGAASRQKLSEQIAMALANESSAPDIIVVSLGTNDGKQTPVDTYEDAMNAATLDDLDRTKLHQSIRYALWTLRKAYPDAVCFVATPIQRADREPLAEISSAIKKLGNRYNFIVIDGENESGIVRENEVWLSNGHYLKDGLHPNEAGAKRIAQLYASVILRTII